MPAALIFRRFAALLALLLVASCAIAPPPSPVTSTPARPAATVTRAQFDAVVRRMSPVATEVCRERSPQLRCEFTVILDDRPSQPPNAFHTRDRDGRPIIAFTDALIRELQTPDEIALIFGHEAGHHIGDHLPLIQREAQRGAILGGVAALLIGADEATARQIMDVSATVGARRYSKPIELEADRLGALIAERAGYDALRGAEIFRRIPDPGNRFLATHPPNAERLREVERTVARVRAGQPI
ncbi:MAG: peptidase M48 [Rhodobacteraceae bacterium]|nr:MAG: peptidase M48 [Paracoccaceae bacterium]